MTLVRCVLFSLAVLFSFTLFANLLPQVQSDPPAETEAASLPRDKAGLIARGQALFNGKGSCALCHNALGRAPDLMALELAAVFAGRLADPRYGGRARALAGAAAVETYVRESMREPSAYVVAGFGQRGSNDTVSPMPRIDAPPISLSQGEMDALVAFLLDKAGLPVTVPPPAQEQAGRAGAASEAIPAAEAPPAATAQAALERFLCPACHDLGGSAAAVGPKLDDAGRRLGRAGLREAILAPNARIADGFAANIMPQDFARRMRVSELELILDHLMAAGRQGGKP